MKVGIKEIIEFIKLALLILTHGKEVVEAIGEIVDEIKDWFRKDPHPKNEWKAKREIKQRIEPLLTASRGRYASSKELNKVTDLMWNTDGSIVKKMTRRSGKTAGRN